MVKRHELTDKQWKQLEPLLPPQKQETGRPNRREREAHTPALTPGQRHETTSFHRLMETGAVKREGRGRPEIRPCRLIGDKAYSRGAIRKYKYLADRHIRITIPRRRDETKTGLFNKIISRMRNRIERFINRMKHFRAIAARYDKSASSYRTLWIIGAISYILMVAVITLRTAPSCILSRAHSCPSVPQGQ